MKLLPNWSTVNKKKGENIEVTKSLYFVSNSILPCVNEDTVFIDTNYHKLPELINLDHEYHSRQLLQPIKAFIQLNSLHEVRLELQYFIDLCHVNNDYFKSGAKGEEEEQEEMG